MGSQALKNQAVDHKPIVASCACGKRYTILEWIERPVIGTVHIPADEFGPEALAELRNCTCNSTIGRELK